MADHTNSTTTSAHGANVESDTSQNENDQVAAWDAAYAAFSEARTKTETLPAGSPDEDAAVNAFCAAMDTLFELPAPDLRAVNTKLSLALDRFEDAGSVPIDVLEHIQADLGDPAVDAIEGFALAWIDRFRALGGMFCRQRDREMNPLGLAMSMPMSYTWTPPAQHDNELHPSERILKSEDFEGAQKMLYSFLTLVPGAKVAIRRAATTLDLIYGEHL